MNLEKIVDRGQIDLWTVETGLFGDSRDQKYKTVDLYSV